MANKQNKENAIVSFLTANSIKFDKVKASFVSRKQDSKDLNKDAKRFLQANVKESSKLNDFIETTKNKMFTDVKTLIGFFGKDFIIAKFAETNELDTLPCLANIQKSLVKEHGAEITSELFLQSLKTCFKNHIARTDKTRKDVKLSTNAKLVFTGNESELLSKAIKVYADKVAKDAKGKANAANG